MPRPDAAGLPPLTYLTVDSVVSGVGTSQVLPYITRLADRGLDVTLHTFEVGAPPTALTERLRRARVTWHPHHFGLRGPAGGAARVVAGAIAVGRRPLVHCRSDLPAASALLGKPRAWVWDLRSFWIDQRIAMGMVRPDSAQDRIMRSIESASVRQAAAVTTLTAAAVTELSLRHDRFDPRAATVVPTCVDLDRFSAAALPPASPVVVLLSGSLNGLYDVPTTLCLIERLRAHTAVVIRHLRPASAPADAALDSLRASGASIASVAFADMPGEIRSAHVGLSICHADLGAAISGAAPTKVAEFLACGRPVVVNAGLGDFDELLTHHRAGVVLGGTSEDELDRGAIELLHLLADPATPARCRALAEKCFDVDDAVDRLLAVYRRASERLC